MLTFEAKYGEVVNATVKNLSDSVWVEIHNIEGNFVVHESYRPDEIFRPKQFHFHAPSEHTIDGRHYDIEMNFYHETEDHAHKSVVAIFFDTRAGNQENDFISSLFKSNDN